MCSEFLGKRKARGKFPALFKRLNFPRKFVATAEEWSSLAVAPSVELKAQLACLALAESASAWFVASPVVVPGSAALEVVASAD